MIRLDVDPRRFLQATKDFTRYSKKSGQMILFDQAKGFIRRAIALTPPAKGKADSAAKKRGEDAIAADLSRILKPADAQFIELFERVNGGNQSRELFGHKGAKALGFVYTKVLSKGDLVSWHNDRRKNDGRVMQVNRDATTGLRTRDLKGLDVGLVEDRTYQWFKKRVQQRVGLLAGGWNAAAVRFGYRPPAWILRHGTGRGGVEITMGDGRFEIRIDNDVPYARAVKDFPRRVQSALNQQAQAMEKRVAYFLEKDAKRAGFKAR